MSPAFPLLLAIIKKRIFLNTRRLVSSSFGSEPTRNWAKRIDPVALGTTDRALEGCNRTADGRRRDRSDSLIRHARATVASPISVLPTAVRLFAGLGLLVAPIGGAPLLLSGSASTSCTAISLASVAMAADEEHGTALLAATAQHPENYFLRGWFRRGHTEQNPPYNGTTDE